MNRIKLTKSALSTLRGLAVFAGIALSLLVTAHAIDWHPQKSTNGKWGFWQDKTRDYAWDHKKYSYPKWLAEPIYEWASEFNTDSIAVVMLDGKYRFINLEGKNLFPYGYDAAENFYQGIAIVGEKGRGYYAIDLNGQPISRDFKQLHHEGPIIWGKEKGEDEYRLYNADFQPISDRKFDDIDVRYFPYWMPDKSPCYYIIYKHNGLTGFCDVEGKDVVPAKYKRTTIYQSKPKPDHYLGIYVGWKKLRKDGIDDDDWGWFKDVMDPKTEKWGAIDLKDGSLIVPLKYDEFKLHEKGSKKAYKGFRAKMKSAAYRDSVFAVYGPATRKTVQEYAAISQAKHPQKANFMEAVNLTLLALTPDSVTGDDRRMVLMRGDKQFGEPYRHIEKVGNVLVVTDTIGNVAVMPVNSTTYPDFQYSEVSLWEDSGYPGLIVGKGDKYGLMDYNGKMLTPIEFDMIFPKETSTASRAIKDGLYYIVDREGKVSRRGYDDAAYIKGVHFDVMKYGITTDYYPQKENWGSKTYYEETPTLYENAVKRVNGGDGYVEQARAWEIAAELADNTDDKGNAYNNAGVVCINNNDRDGGYYYYEKGAALGNKYAISNLNVLRNQDGGGGSNGWVQLAEALSDLANNINGHVQNYYNQKQRNQNRSTSTPHRSSDSTSRLYSGSTSSSGNSKEYYQSRYNRWEKVARSTYESATNLGVKVKDKAGNDIGGKYGGKTIYWSTYKTNLVKAQREMRDIRLEAKRNGITIQLSTYETVNLVI